jgi:hypothetical protein
MDSFYKFLISQLRNTINQLGETDDFGTQIYLVTRRNLFREVLHQMNNKATKRNVLIDRISKLVNIQIRQLRKLGSKIPSYIRTMKNARLMLLSNQGNKRLEAHPQTF